MGCVIMAKYQAQENADFFSYYVAGVLFGKVAGVRAGEVIEAVDLLNGVLKVSATRWTRKRWFNLVIVTNPNPQPTPTPTPSSGDLWQFLPSDNPREYLRNHPGTDGTADVVVLSEEPPDTQMTRAWQLFLLALNPGMQKNNIVSLIGTRKAFSNGTGFPTRAGDPEKANWIDNTFRDYPVPTLDKDRTCAFNYCTGVQTGSYVLITTLDGNAPPPDINLVNPITHPYLFFHCTIVKQDGRIRPFPNGAPAWGVNMNVVFLPLVSMRPIFYPLSRLRPVSEIRLPYT